MERCSCMDYESFITAATAISEAADAELDLIYDPYNKEYVWLNKKQNIITLHNRLATKKEMIVDIEKQGYTVWIAPAPRGFY